MASPVFIVDIGPDGAVAVHPRRLQLPVLLSPIAEERKSRDVNTVREPLVAIGCMRLPDRSFEFDSSLISPRAEERLTKFAEFMKALREQDDASPKRFPPISVFGHADPTGREAYNATLSGRRALAVYALLTRQPKLWDLLFKGFGGDVWDRRAVRLMLSTSLRKPKGQPPQPPSPEPPFFAGPLDAATPADKPQLERDTDAAIEDYKRGRAAELGVKNPDRVDARLDGATRTLLFTEYMDAICHDAAGERFVLDAQRDFIARAQDKAGLKGDVQGCGEFNPIFLVSKDDDERFAKDEDHTERNAAYARDRRVLAFVFRHGTRVDPGKWPCPVAPIQAEASAGVLEACKKRFWSDAKKRLACGDEERTFGEEMALAEPDDDGNFELDDAGHVRLRDVAETGNTMACRFYHGFAAYSPCEAGLKEWVVRFRIDGLSKPNKPALPVPLAGRRFVLTMGESAVAAVVRGTLDAKGELRVPELDPHVLLTVKIDAWGRVPDPDAPPAPAPDPKDSELVDGRFRDEDRFMSLTLDAGALKLVGGVGDVDDLASRQRLYNLGFGPPEPRQWDRERDQVPAASAFRHSRVLPDDADLRTALREEHELSDPDPPPDPDQDPTVGSAE